MDPKTMQEGMRILADWFDAVYHDAGKNDAVQQDLRRWANEVDALQSNMTAEIEKLMAIKEAAEKVVKMRHAGYPQFLSNALNDLERTIEALREDE